MTDVEARARELYAYFAGKIAIEVLVSAIERGQIK